MSLIRTGFRSGPARTSLAASLALASLAAAASDAHAGDFAGLTNTDWQIGGIVFVTPKYEGAKDYEVLGAPFIAPAGLDDTSRVQFRGPDDLRFRAIEFSGFEAGPLVGWRFDREESDSSHLDGLGDVDGGLVVGGYAAYRLGPISPFVSYHHQVTGDDTGALVRFGAEAKTPLSGGIKLTTSVGATYADDDFMDAYFSVTPAQSAASTAGLGVYDAEAGIKDVFVGFTSDVPLSGPWSLKLAGRYSRLVGDAADSPVVESEDQFFGGLGLSYRFGP
jgi:outer membrane protein